MSLQLTLQLTANQHCSFANFHPVQNEELVFSLKNTIVKHNIKFMHLWGAPGVGKTHLLQASCQYSHQLNKASCYFSIHELMKLSPEALDELSSFTLICIDDLHALPGKLNFEEKMFGWYNWCLDNDVVVITAGDQPISALPFILKDLKSRLSLSAVYHLNPLQDQDKMVVLNLHAKQRGISLPNDVSGFLLKRYSRDLPKLIEMLDLLDGASLTKKRKLTIPFVKEIIKA